MKLTSLGLAVLAISTNAAGQYFSEGWKPGQAVTKSGTGYTYPTATQSGSVSAGSTPTANSKSPFDFSSILEVGPLKALFQKAGVNISEKLEAARQSVKIWDDRINLITDDNYRDLIVDEKFSSLEEERDRVWFLVISVTRADREGISRLVDERFDGAFELEQQRKELPHVRWGRLDYLNVTAITTKWVVWRAPVLVVLKDRGQTLRFFKPYEIPMNEEYLHEFLKQNAFEHHLPWKSIYGPGGSREYVLDYLAIALTKIYNVFILVPRWVLVILTGAIASTAINLLHSARKTPRPPSNGNADEVATESDPSTTSTTTATAAKSEGNKISRKRVKK